MNTRVKKAAILGLSACLALTSLAGCSKKEDEFDTTATALTINGSELSAGVVSFAAHYNQVMIESFYASYLGTEDPLNVDLYGDGTTLGDSLKEQVVDSLTEMVLAEQHMADYEVEVTEEEKSAITAAAAAFLEANDEEALKAMGATQESVERYLELYTIEHKMEHAMPADVDTNVTDEEAAQRRVQYTMFVPSTEAETEEETETDSEGAEAETEASAQTEGETSPETAALTEEDSVKTGAAAETESETGAETAAETEAPEAGSEAVSEESTEAVTEEETETETEDPAMVEARAKAKAEAQAMLDNIMGGMTFEEAAEAAGKAANEMTFGVGDEETRAELMAATDGLADDTLVEEVVETDSGYYVVKVISQLDREATDTEKENIISDRKNERISELFTEWKDASEITQDDEVLAAIVFDAALSQYVETETETESSTEAESGSETETESGSEAATETESDAEAATEAPTEAGQAAEASTEAPAETAEAETE